MKSFFLVLIFSFSAFSQDWGSVSANKNGTQWVIELKNSQIEVKYSNAGSKQGVSYDRITRFYSKVSNSVLASKLDGRQANSGVGFYQITDATIVTDDDVKKTVRINFGNGQRITHATIYKDSPVLRLDYLTGNHNLDYGINGGNYVVYGADEWQAQNNWSKKYPTLQDNTTYSGSYFRSQWSPPGPLDYNGMMIMGVYDASTGWGVGLTLPSTKVTWIKLILDLGFERWMTTAHAAYLYASEGGASGVISRGKEIANGNLPVSTPLKILVATSTDFGFQSLFPNPFKVSSTIQFNLPLPGVAEIGFYNIYGKKIDRFNYQGVQAGQQQVIWTAKDNLGHPIAPGVYFCSIAWEGHRANRQFNIIK